MIRRHAAVNGVEVGLAELEVGLRGDQIDIGAFDGAPLRRSQRQKALACLDRICQRAGLVLNSSNKTKALEVNVSSAFCFYSILLIRGDSLPS